jgi:hypothetical protein
MLIIENMMILDAGTVNTGFIESLNMNNEIISF